MTSLIERETDYLFNCDFAAEDYDPEGAEERLERAERLIQAHPWRDVFDAWNNYLRAKCSTPEEVVNFCVIYSTTTEGRIILYPSLTTSSATFSVRSISINTGKKQETYWIR